MAMLSKLLKLLLTILLTGCGNHLLISSYGHRGSIEHEKLDSRLRLEEDKIQSREVYGKRQVWNWFGHLLIPETELGRVINTTNPNKIPIEDFTITTTYRWRDVILGIIPFLSTRTIEYSGNYVQNPDLEQMLEE